MYKIGNILKHNSGIKEYPIFVMVCGKISGYILDSNDNTFWGVVIFNFNLSNNYFAGEIYNDFNKSLVWELSSITEITEYYIPQR